MKKPAILSLSLLTLSAMMAMETPVLAATRNYVPTALVSHAAPADGSASKTKTSLISATNTALTSRTAYGVIYNDVYSSARSDLLKKFNQANKALYMSEGLSDSFAYFNADKYLEEYADVKEGLAGQLSDEEKNDQKALRQAALSHYVEYGMQEGRDCGTAFNPVIALLAYPELYSGVSDLSPDNIRKIFQDNVHAEDTSEFSIYFYTVNDIEMLSIVRNKKTADATRYTMKDVLDDAGISVQNPSSKDTSSTKDDSSVLDDSSILDDTPKKDSNVSDKKDMDDLADFELPSLVPHKLNDMADDVSPYKLYSLTGNSSELSIPGKATTNYNKIKDKLTDKYTLMIYMCGTDLEDAYQLACRSIRQMLKAAPKNMNIVLLLGGTDQYSSDYLDKTIGKEKIGIYYLNRDKISEDETDIINENTLVNLATFDPASIGDPSLLSGFMDLSTDLFPAKDYGLIMWNHGGGVIHGICMPDETYLENNEKFDINDLESAFRSSNLVKRGDKLGLLAFDACLMGSSEIAYNLHNYYNYMYASEDVAHGNYNYARIFADMDSRLSSGNATAYSMIQAIHNNFSYNDSDGELHTGTPYFQQTGSVYDGAATEKYAMALNNMGKQLNHLIQIAPYEGDDVLRTLANARMKCETLCLTDKDTNNWGLSDPEYTDIGELTHYLKTDLTVLKEQALKAGASDAYINAIQKSIDSVIALRKTGCLVMTSTWYNRNEVRSYTGQQAISMEDLQAKAPMSDFWNKAQGTTASYGTSVYFPVFYEPLKDYIPIYSNFYDQTPLSDYTALVRKMVEWKKSADYTLQEEALANKMDSLSMFESSAIEDLGDKTSPQYLVVKFKEQYAKEDTPATSFGSPLCDFMSVMKDNPKIYATCSIKDEKGNPINSYTKVVLKNNMHGEHFNLADSSMNMQLNCLSGYSIYQNGTSDENKPDYKLIREDSSNPQIISAVTNEDLSMNTDLYRVVEGSSDHSDTLYHVFQRDGDDRFVYIGSSTYCKEDEVYKKTEDIKQLSFYDHYLHKTADNSIELVSSNDHEFTENVTAPIKYSNDKNAFPIFLKKFTLDSTGTGNNSTNLFNYAASIDLGYPDSDDMYERTTVFTGECTTKNTWNAEKKTDAESKATDDTNADTDETSYSDADTDVDTDETSYSDADTNVDTDETSYYDADINAAAGESTDSEQESGEETDVSETLITTEEVA